MQIDPQLIKDCKKGDRKAQYNLYRLCYPMLMGVCLRYHKQESDAVAVLNEGFLKILTKLDQFRSEVPFQAWIKRVMINTLIDDYRKNRKVKELIEYTDFQDYQLTESQIDWNEADKQFDAEQLERFIQKLPSMSQKVFNLFAIDGYTHKEIGEMLGISDGTSKWHLSSARKKLAEWLKRAMNSSKVI
ncbi:MAG: RNA polymerase sigma factor [Saprospiraceae bacterium]|nr:RNA polymerase sigma factor [Saprospiraceae bacterium]